MLLRAALVLALGVAGLAGAQEEGMPVLSSGIGPLSEAVERDPENLGLRLRLAMALLQPDMESAHPDVARRRLDQARSHLDFVLEQDPDARIPLRVRALECYGRGEYARAVALGRRHLDLVPVDPEISTRVVRALVELGRPEEAAEAFVDWVRSEGMRSFGEVLGMLRGLVGRATCREALGRKIDAAVAEEPGHVLLVLLKAAFLARQGHTMEAWSTFHRAERKGLCSLRTGARHPFAAQLLEGSIEPDAGPASYPGSDPEQLLGLVRKAPEHAGLALRLARTLDLDDKDDEALEWYARAFSLNPALWTAEYRRAELLMGLERFGKAARGYRRVLELVPEFPGARVRLARALVEQGELEAALEVLIPLAKSFEPGERMRAIYERMAAQEQDDGTGLDSALRTIEGAVAAEPSNPALRAHLVMALLVGGLKARARREALAMERAGIVGPDGAPHALLLEAFDRRASPDGGPEGSGDRG